MEFIETLGLTLLSVVIGVCAIWGLADIIGEIKDSFTIKKQNKEDKENSSKEKETESLDYKAKYENFLNKYPYNKIIDEWVNKVLDDGVMKIYGTASDLYSDVYYYTIETPNYIFTYWHQNLFYAMANRGDIKNKNNEILFQWKDYVISKDTRYRLYQIEESMKELCGNKTIPIIYSNTKNRQFYC